MTFDAKSFWKAACCALVALCATVARAQVVIRQDFEGPEVSWRDGRGNPSYRIESHLRTGDRPHGGSGCEYMQLVAGANGTFVYMIHDLSAARLISELQPSLWVRSDKPGIQLRARVVFPRSTDPKTGEPATALLAGSSYTKAQNWEQLRFDDLPKLAADQARVLRAELKRDVDVREAYIDRLILNIYTGPGRTRLWIDDLEVAGFVGDERQAGGRPPPASSGMRTPIIEREPGGSLPAPRREGPKLNGSILMVGNRPFFPRVIEHQGEKLAFLRERGFNCVRLRSLATPELLDEAVNAGVWLICPPPMPKGLDGRGEVTPLPAIPPEFDSVVAWDLGEGLTGRELDAVKRWAEQVRRADPRSRPIVCGASAELRAYSSRADVLLLDRFTTATSFELVAYRRWLQIRPRLARPGTPIWTTVSTEAAASLVNQVRTLSSGRTVSLMTGTEHARLLTYTALGSGARGLFFASHAPLDAEDNDTRWRADQLELLNLELDLIEPWAASGTPIGAIASSDPEVAATVLQAGGAYILLPVWSGKGAQYVPGQAALATKLSFVAPVSETVNAYEIIPGGLRPLLTERCTGGVRVTLDDFGVTTMIILTQNLSSELTRRANAAGERAARLHVAMSKIKLDVAADVQSRIKNDTRATNRATDLLKTAREEQLAAETALASSSPTAINGYADAIRQSQFADRNVRTFERAQWLAAIGKLPSPTTDPLAVSFATLPQHFILTQNIAAARRSENRLPEGDCEDVARLMNRGWQHFQHPPKEIRAGVQRSEVKKFGGKYSLRLAAAANDPLTEPAQIETPPVWITTPRIPLEPGTLVRLHARVLEPGPVLGSPDGLLILDSLGGEVLAERFASAPDWKEWNAYRMVDDSGTVTITFALCGLGEVWIDDISIEPLVSGSPTAPRTPPAATQPGDDVARRRDANQRLR